MLLPEKVRVPLCFKCRWLLSEDPTFRALPRLKCGPCAFSPPPPPTQPPPTQWVLYTQVLQMGMEWHASFLLQVSLFLQFKRIIPALRRLSPSGSRGS